MVKGTNESKGKRNNVGRGWVCGWVIEMSEED